VHRVKRFEQVVAASAGGAQGSEGGSAQPGGRWACSGGVGDDEPRAVPVLDEVEPRARLGRPLPRVTTQEAMMQIDKETILNFLREQGDHEKAKQADDQLPD
jgi:hypothetical protein